MSNDIFRECSLQLFSCLIMIMKLITHWSWRLYPYPIFPTLPKSDDRKKVKKRLRGSGDNSNRPYVGCTHNHGEKTRRELGIYGICVVIMFRDSPLSWISLQTAKSS